MHLADHSVLVVDHTDLIRTSLAHQLELAGCTQVLQAANLARAELLLQGRQIDLVLSEIAGPADGLGLLQIMRQRDDCTPVVLMSGEVSRAVLVRALELGISDLLVKPFTSRRVIDRVTRALRRAYSVGVDAGPQPGKSAPRSTSVAAPELAPERPTVLVVDDTPDNLQLLAGLFRERYKVKLASNGEKALSICHSDTPPDLILLDVMMPGMDGFEVARQVRAHHASSHTPIIFVTALTDEASRQRGLALGAIDYVHKPIDPDLLQLRVSNLLHYVEHRKQMQLDVDRQREIADLRRQLSALQAASPVKWAPS